MSKAVFQVGSNPIRDIQHCGRPISGLSSSLFDFNA
jgi:hypothetical protein